MTQSKKRNLIIYLLIAFVCRVAQDLFNPYLSLDSYTNWRMWLLVIIDAAVLTIGLTLEKDSIESSRNRDKRQLN